MKPARLLKPVLFLALSVMSSVSTAADSAPTLNDVINFSAAKDESASAAKIKAIKEAGMRSGAQAGMMNRARELITKINGRSVELDRIFEFQPLIDTDGFLPPVISSTSQKVETLNGAQRLEFAGVTYKIIAQARFVRVAPTWRDYVFAGIGDKRLSVDRLPDAIKPSSSDERSAWREAVSAGWLVGQQQADDIFSENMARLKRDYLGMIQYLALLKQGMIKRPILSKTPDSIRITDDEISIGVGVSEIQLKATMEKDIGAWGEIK